MTKLRLQQAAYTLALLVCAAASLWAKPGPFHALAWTWAAVAQGFYFWEENQHHRTLNQLSSRPPVI